MGIKLNLTGEEIKSAQGNFTPLPEGIYGAVVYDAKYGNAKSSGNPMYTLTFKILEGPEGVNRQIKGYFSLTAKALFKVVELNKAVGFPYPNKDTPAGEFEFNDADDYLSKKVNLQIIQEPYLSVEEDEDGVEQEVTAYRNNIKKVLKYNEDTIDTAETAAESGTKSGGLFL